MDMIDFAGCTVYKDAEDWVKVAQIGDRVGIGIVSPDGKDMKSVWLRLR